MKHFCFLLIGLTALYSCSGTGSSNTNNVIDIESALGTGKIRNASEFIKEIKYIPLETTPGSMIGNIANVIIEHRKIYVRDDKNVITIFDLNGKYLNTLNRVGRGPEEYMSVSDFEVAPNGNIFIASRREGLLEYGADLKFIRKISLEGGADAGLSDLAILKEGLFASNTMVFDMETRSAKQEWKIYDESLNTLFSYSTDPQVQASSSGSGENTVVAIGVRANPYQYYMHNNDLSLFRRGNDTIFNIDYENNYLKSARYIVNCGKYRFLEEMESGPNMSNLGASAELEAISLRSMIETANYLFMTFDFRKLAPEPFEATITQYSMGGVNVVPGGFPNTNVYVAYNKNRGELSVLNQPIPKTLGLKEDIAQGHGKRGDKQHNQDRQEIQKNAFADAMRFQRKKDSDQCQRDENGHGSDFEQRFPPPLIDFPHGEKCEGNVRQPDERLQPIGKPGRKPCFFENLVAEVHNDVDPRDLGEKHQQHANHQPEAVFRAENFRKTPGFLRQHGTNVLHLAFGFITSKQFFKCVHGFVVAVLSGPPSGTFRHEKSGNEIKCRRKASHEEHASPVFVDENP